MPTMKEMYYAEACFDYIDKSHIVSDRYRFHTVNIMDLKDSNVDFIVSYNLKLGQTSNWNAFAIWIEVAFNHVHLPLKINYGPFCEKSSYYPIILYLKREVQVQEGQKITGSIAVRKLEKGGKKLVLGKVSHTIPGVVSQFQFYKIDF